MKLINWITEASSAHLLNGSDEIYCLIILAIWSIICFLAARSLQN